MCLITAEEITTLQKYKLFVKQCVFVDKVITMLRHVNATSLLPFIWTIALAQGRGDCR